MKSNFDEKNFLGLIQKTLLYSVIISALLLFIGFPLFLYAKNDAIVGIGILILILTPVLRVFMLLYGFMKLKEYNFAIASFVVLVLMGITILI